jgi:hypothetical protein
VKVISPQNGGCGGIIPADVYGQAVANGSYGIIMLVNEI